MNARCATCVLVLVAALGCGGAEDQLGVSEPFRVSWSPNGNDYIPAQFVAGSLPGKRPEPGANPAPVSDAGTAVPPQITLVMSQSNVVFQGEGAKKLAGEATTVTRAIGMQLLGVGGGYWVFPAGGINPQSDNLIWDAHLDFGRDIAPGKRDLRMVAIDEDAVAGQQTALSLCVEGRVPDNLHVCDPDRALPKAVISLSWDTNVDLDLQVKTPGGQWIDAKHPMTASPDPDGGLPDDAGIIDRDSNAACVIDGLRDEDLVWSNVMPQGRYGIYANLFNACHQPAVRFRVAVYTAATDKDGNDTLKQVAEQGGEVLGFSANNGAEHGLFVTEFTFH